MHPLGEIFGLKVACPEEIAYHGGFIDAEQVCRLAWPLRRSSYGQYLMQLIEEEPAIAMRRPAPGLAVG